VTTAHHEISLSVLRLSRLEDLDGGEELAVALAEHLESVEGIVDPVIEVDIRSQVLHVSVEVDAATEPMAFDLAAVAVGDALINVGAADEYQVASPTRGVLIG